MKAVYNNRGVKVPGMIMEEGGATKDACYHKVVKSKYDVWPSAYASGAMAKCRKWAQLIGVILKRKNNGCRKTKKGAALRRWFKEVGVHLEVIKIILKVKILLDLLSV